MPPPKYEHYGYPNKWTPNQVNKFLDMWWELYPRSFNSAHRRTSGVGVGMIRDLLVESNVSYDAPVDRYGTILEKLRWRGKTPFRGISRAARLPEKFRSR